VPTRWVLHFTRTPKMECGPDVTLALGSCLTSYLPTASPDACGTLHESFSRRSWARIRSALDPIAHRGPVGAGLPTVGSIGSLNRRSTTPRRTPCIARSVPRIDDAAVVDGVPAHSALELTWAAHICECGPDVTLGLG